MSAGNWAKVAGSGQGLPGTTFSALDFGTISVDTDSILTETAAGVYRPDSEGYYLIVTEAVFQLTHNNRFNVHHKIRKNSTDVDGAHGSGYGRNASNDEAYVRAMMIQPFNGSSDTFDIQQRRDAGAGTNTGSYIATRIKVTQLTDSTSGIPFLHIGTPAANAYGGQGYAVTTGWDVITETDDTVLSLENGQDIRLRETGRPYLIVYGAMNSDSGGARTTRMSKLFYNDDPIHHSIGYAYQRNSADQYAVPNGMGLVKPTTADLDVDLRIGGYIDNHATLWGTFDNGTWTLSATEAGVFAIALPAAADVAIYEDETGNQTVNGSGVVDINAFRTTINENGVFSRTGNTAVDVTGATDVLGYAAHGIERTASSGTRGMYGARFEVEGTDQTDTEAQKYLRGEQGGDDTKNTAIGSLLLDALSANDTINFEKFISGGQNSGANDVTDVAGGFFIDLATLGGAPQTVAVGTLTETDSLVAVDADQPQNIAVGTLAETDSLIAVDADQPQSIAVGTLAETDSLIAAALGGPSHDWTTYFVPPAGMSSQNSGDETDVDEWPFTRTDNAYIQTTGSATDNIEFTGFDLSAAPGDKKGFVLWFQAYVDNAGGYTIDEIRLVEGGGPTTLWTNSSPGITITDTAGNENIWVVEIPDSAFSGDPDIDDLDIEFDVTNDHTGNNRLRISGIRLSKSPFTAAEEEALPSDLDGQDYSGWTVSGLETLGVAEDESIVVIPDVSGNGRHLLRWVGSCEYKSADGGYIDFATGTPCRFITSRETEVTGNHIWHLRAHWYDVTVTTGVIAGAPEFIEYVVDGRKPVIGTDDDGSGDEWVIMFGDGTGGAHLHGGTPVDDTWFRLTVWVQDSGNEHLWENDDASPVIDAASGSNDWQMFSLGDRETDDRPFEGRFSELWVVDGAGITEGEIDDARDEWVNGPATGQTIAVGTLAETNTLISAIGQKSATVGVITETDTLISAAAEKPIVGLVGTLAGVDSPLGIQAVKPIIGAVGTLPAIETLIPIGVIQPISVAIGTVAALDSLVPVGAIKPIIGAVGTLNELNQLVAVQALKDIITTVGTLAELETLISIGVLKPQLIPVGTTSETETLNSILAEKLASIGTLNQLDALVGISGRKTATVGVITETATLNPISVLKPLVIPVGSLPQLETLNPVNPHKLASIGTLTELDQLIGIQGRKASPVGTLTEVDQLVAVQALKDIITTVGTLAEIDTLTQLDPLKVATVGTLTEFDQLIGIPPQKLAAVGTMTEIDGLVAVASDSTISVGTLAELETLISIGVLKPQLIPVGTTSETETLNSILAEKLASIGTLNQLDALVGISGRKTATVGVITETATLNPISVLKPLVIPVGSLPQLETLNPVNPHKLASIGTLTELDQLTAISHSKLIAVGTLAQNDLLVPVDVNQPTDVLVGTISELDTLLSIGAIIVGTPWWKVDPAGYSNNPVAFILDPAGYSNNPVAFILDPAEYTPATPDKNPPF